MKNSFGMISPFSIKGRCFLQLLAVMFTIIVLLTACSIESKLNRQYKGRSFSEVMAVMGAPTNIENLVGGGTLRTYQKKVMLRETPINTGHFQYDKFDSPKVLKTEISQFKVDDDGIVKEIKYSCTYSK
jgi:hypothetical protein